MSQVLRLKPLHINLNLLLPRVGSLSLNKSVYDNIPLDTLQYKRDKRSLFLTMRQFQHLSCGQLTGLHPFYLHTETITENPFLHTDLQGLHSHGKLPLLPAPVSILKFTSMHSFNRLCICKINVFKKSRKTPALSHFN